MSQDYKVRREFTTEILEASFFGAFMLAVDVRKKEEGLTQATLAQRTGREKTGMSKLLSGPRNWQISTIAALAEALDLRLEFVLVDERDPHRRFTPTGISHITPVNLREERSGGFVGGLSTPCNLVEVQRPSANLLANNVGGVSVVSWCQPDDRRGLQQGDLVTRSQQPFQTVTV